MLEGLLRSFNDMYGLPYVALRYFNVYGPRMDIHGKCTEVLIRWMERIDAGQPPIVLGDGTQTMDFVYVEDAVDAFLRAGATDTVNGEVFNVGGDDHFSHRDLVALLVRTAGTGRYRFVEWPPEKKAIDIGSFYADSTLFKSRTDWAPRVRLEEGLRRTIEYYRPRMAQYV